MGSIIEISDLQDPRLEDYRDLRDADLRGARKLFTVESLRVVRRFLRSGWPADSILLEPRAARELAAELETVPPEVPVYPSSERLHCCLFLPLLGVFALPLPASLGTSEAFLSGKPYVERRNRKILCQARSA